MANTDKYIIVNPGDRLDILAYKLLGDSTAYGELISANPNLNIFAPVIGTKVVAPSAR